MDNINSWTPPQNIKMIQQKGTFTLTDNANTYRYIAGDSETGYSRITSLTLTVTDPSGKQIVFKSNLEIGKKPNEQYPDLGDSTCYKDTEFNIPLNKSGEYQFRFTLSYAKRLGRPLTTSGGTHTATTYIYVNPDSSELKPYTLGDTIRRVLNLTPTRTVDESPKYTFDTVQLAEYDKEESPEFSFSGHTLFEALLLIAQYKGAFPQLDENGVISFRKLWNDKFITEAELPPPIDEISLSDINQYCTHLDTEVQNLVGVNNSQAGSIVEPYAGGYKTTRAASGSEISQDTVVIPTDYNQYLHIKEEIGYINGVLPANNDLTAYVYESGDYNALTDKAASYPASKAYALQWSQMEQNVTELSHRTKADSGLIEAFYQPAIANIIQAKTGIEYDTGIVGYLQKLIGVQDGNSFADLMFRTTYIPVINSRIKQYKENFSNFHYDGSLKYNQTAELVDSELYGEHLKQLIRKIGNATKQKIYIFEKMDDVPKVGTVVDGYSVYDVQMSIRENKVIATISFVKYAELSQYIGVKNPWKDSDVSTDKCYNRNISYNEFLLFSHSDWLARYGSETLSVAALRGLMNFTSSSPLTCVEATGYYTDGSPLNTVLLPVVSLAMGNSVMFQWGYKNNYSAGYMSEEAPSGATSVISGTKYNRAQKAVKYCDMYGRLKTYDFKLLRSGPVPHGYDIGWQTDDGVKYSIEYVMRQIGYSLPLKPEKLVGWTGEGLITVNDLFVDKNSSEALTFSVQLHYCTNNENFIIGSGLTNFCSLVGGQAQEVALFGFNERINIFNRRFSVEKATQLLYPVFTATKRKVEILLPRSINDYQAWAYMGKDKNGNWQIIFGENRDFKGSAFNTELYLLPMHKLEDFI